MFGERGHKKTKDKNKRQNSDSKQNRLLILNELYI